MPTPPAASILSPGAEEAGAAIGGDDNHGEGSTAAALADGEGSGSDGIGNDQLSETLSDDVHGSDDWQLSDYEYEMDDDSDSDGEVGDSAQGKVKVSVVCFLPFLRVFGTES